MALPQGMINEVDRRFYASHLRGFLPAQMIDVHTHVWRWADCPPEAPVADPRVVTWPSLVARENPIEDLQETYRLLFPEQAVTPLIFSMLPEGDNLAAINAYVAELARTQGVPALLFSDPRWTPAELEAHLQAGGFLGVKSYLTMAPTYLPPGEIRITDFFPEEHLAVLNRRRGIVMLHLPRPGRLKDPVNLAQMLEIERRFPDLQLIITHVGRAYALEDVGQAFEILKLSTHMLFDISANTNVQVFEGLIRCVGPQRILFGSDLPVTRMRMRRITREGRYINLVPRGAYGDVGNDPHMEEVDGEDAARLTTFLYEEIDAFRRAAETTGLTAGEVADVFYHNAARLLAQAKGG